MEASKDSENISDFALQTKSNFESKNSTLFPWISTYLECPTPYPSSSKKAVNWDLLEKELSGDPDVKKLHDDGLTNLFQEIYANASEDAKKAMIKSFVRNYTFSNSYSFL